MSGAVTDHHVHVLGDVVNRAMKHARHTPDRDVGNSVPVEDIDDSGEIEEVALESAQLADRPDTSTHGSSAVRGGSDGYSATARRPADGGCTRPWRANT